LREGTEGNYGKGNKVKRGGGEKKTLALLGKVQGSRFKVQGRAKKCNAPRLKLLKIIADIGRARHAELTAATGCIRRILGFE
jgi:hypothetical protein